MIHTCFTINTCVPSFTGTRITICTIMTCSIIMTGVTSTLVQIYNRLRIIKQWLIRKNTRNDLQSLIFSLVTCGIMIFRDVLKENAGNGTISYTQYLCPFVTLPIH